jgi:hypothetical protein
MAEGEVTSVVTIDKVEHDMATGWYRIHAEQDGSNIRLGTKIREKAEEAASLKGKQVRVWFIEKPSRGTNPHTGQPYPPDRWYQRAEETAASMNGGTGIDVVGEAAAPAIPAASSENPRREWRICLQTGGKLAIQTLPLMPNEQRTFDTQKQIALAWARFFYFSIPPERESMGTPTPSPQQAYGDVPAFAGGGYEEAPPDMHEPPPDDIPW